MAGYPVRQRFASNSGFVFQLLTLSLPLPALLVMILEEGEGRMGKYLAKTEIFRFLDMLDVI